jgi:uncharacterized protein DUF6895
MMRRLGERARAWLDRSIPEFPVIADGESALLAIKRIGELAMLAGTLIDHGDATARPWLELCWRWFDHGAALARVTAEQPAFAAIYPSFHRHALRSEEVERAIGGALPAVVDPALRLLLASALAWCGLASPWDVDRLLDESWLASEPATFDTRAAYVATHVVLFLAPVGRLGERHRRYVNRSLPSWIVRFAREGDLDLAAEMIMVAHALGHCVPERDWSVLADAQEDDGLVPFRAAWRGRAVPPRTRFCANYHSTLVALAAASMCNALCPR